MIKIQNSEEKREKIRESSVRKKMCCLGADVVMFSTVIRLFY